MSTDERPILIIDAMNLFVRSFCAFPSMSANGYQMGGTVGFLKTLARINEMVKPRHVYIAWEGGGSTKRRAIYHEYKQNRKPEKLNRFYEDDIPESDENRKHQVNVLLKLLKHVPVCQIYVSDCEGDDVIAYLVRTRFKGVNKIIVSSDKDMYQLLDDTTTKVYSLHKKTFVDASDVLKEYKVLASNFALAKSLCGDPSDNIPGVKGLGYKSLIAKFPFIGLEHDIILAQLFDFCEANKKESIHYRRILESKDDVIRNWRLVYLSSNTLSGDQGKKVDSIIDEHVLKSEKMQFMKILAHEGLNDFDPTWFFYSMVGIDGPNKEEEK